VTTRHIYCQVLEMPAREDWQGRRSACSRELLPWADPYIAGLIQKLEDRYDAEWQDSSDPFAADDELYERAAFESPSAEWREDAFRPQPLEALRDRWYFPTYGGFPLLEDDAAKDDANELDFR
jgi:hypothetical protein